MNYNMDYMNHPASSLMDNNFVYKYGKYARKFNLLYADGKPNLNVTYPLILSIIILFIGFFALFQSKTAGVEVDGKKSYVDPVKLTPMQQFSRYLSYGLFITSLLFLIYYGYHYIFHYLYQYNKWFRRLPNEAKMELGIIRATANFENQMHNRR